MKKLILCSLFLFLVGCSPSSMDKAKQDFACKDKGGVYGYVIGAYAKCMNGTYVDGWPKLTLTPEFYPNKESQQ